MKNNPTWLPVVAAAIVGPDGRLLMQQRPEGKHHAGLWELPGGKVETRETPVSALVREIKEELDLALDPGALEPVAFAQSGERDGAVPIVILLYRAPKWVGQPEAREGGDWGWFSLEEAVGLPKPPLDVTLLGFLEKYRAEGAD